MHLAGLDSEGNLVVRDTAGKDFGQAPGLQQRGGRLCAPVVFREALCSRVFAGGVDHQAVRASFSSQEVWIHSVLRAVCLRTRTGIRAKNFTRTGKAARAGAGIGCRHPASAQNGGLRRASSRHFPGVSNVGKEMVPRGGLG